MAETEGRAVYSGNTPVNAGSRVTFRGAFFLALFTLDLILFSYLVIGPFGIRLEETNPRLIALALLTLAGIGLLKLALPGLRWGVALAVTLLGIGAVYQVASYIPQVSNFPFSLGWSEASRYYYASLLFSRQIYGIQTALSVLHPTRYLMQSLPFLIPNAPIWVHRLWQVILWLLSTGLAAALLERRLPISNKLEKVLFFIWASLFLLQGPVYYQLLVMVILVLWGFDPRSFWKTMAFVLAASLWAGVSRINWVPVPGMLAASLYFLYKNVGKKGWLAYLLAPASWTLIGSGVGLAMEKVYERFSGNPAYEFGSSFTSDLLWYRLFPSKTFSIGVLPAAFLASTAILLIVALKLWPRWRQYHPIRLLGLAAILLILFGGGTVVSVKIGGGSNLHNLDAYLALLLVITSLIYYGRFEPDQAEETASGAGELAQRGPGWLTRMQSLLMAGAVLAPVAFIVTVGDPMPSLDYQTAYDNLAQIKQMVEQTSQNGGQVLFIGERQLLTFHNINAPLVPDDELVFLMEMSMANNQPYLQAFHNDLKAQKYAIIVSGSLNEVIQGSKHTFGEENDAWVRAVSIPVLCYYKPKFQFPDVNLVLYVPRAVPKDCKIK